MIVVSVEVSAPLEDVWRANTTPDAIMRWNAASDDWHTTTATVELRPGGQFSSRMEARDGSMGFDFAGEYTAVVPHERLAYRFGDRTATVEFSSGEGGVTVTVSFDPETEHPLEMQRAGWQAILDNFARYVAREAERPSAP